MKLYASLALVRRPRKTVNHCHSFEHEYIYMDVCVCGEKGIILN